MVTFQKVKLGNLVELITKGTTPSTIGKKFTDKGVNFIKSESITKEGFIDEKSFAFIDEETHRALKRSIIKEKDILFSIAGIYLAKSAIIKKMHLPANTNQAVAIIRLNHKLVDYKYINYVFSTKEFIKKIYGFKGQAAQPNVSLGDLKSLDITIPQKKDDQTRIASVLSAYDDLIGNNEKRIRALEEMAQLLYTEWFVKFKFPGHKKVKMVDTGTEYGEIPDGWEVRNVESLIKRIPVGKKYENKTVFETGKVPVLDQGKSGFIGYHNDKPGVNASVDNPVIVFANHTCYQNVIVYPFSAIQNVFPFTPNDERDIFWLHWATKDLIKFNDYKGHWPEFMSKKLIVPTVELTKRFGVVVGKSVTMKYSLESENKNLSETRDLLIPQLVIGKRELK